MIVFKALIDLILGDARAFTGFVYHGKELSRGIQYGTKLILLIIRLHAAFILCKL